VTAEAPKIAPHIPAMRKKIAPAIGATESRVSIKATTNERLGAIGRGEGIAAMAIATVEVEAAPSRLGKSDEGVAST